MLTPSQIKLSRTTLNKLGILALPNKLEKSFGIYNTSFEDEISFNVKSQVEKYSQKLLVKNRRNRVVARSLDAVSLKTAR